jgi:hypothetical protein
MSSSSPIRKVCAITALALHINMVAITVLRILSIPLYPGIVICTAASGRPESIYCPVRMERIKSRQPVRSPAVGGSHKAIVVAAKT